MLLGIKGDAKLDYVKTPTKREGTTLVTKFQVKNMSEAPIPRLRIVETWYDKDGNVIPGGEAVINGLLHTILGTQKILCFNVDYAGVWATKPWRFYERRNRYVSVAPRAESARSNLVNATRARLRALDAAARTAR